MISETKGLMKRLMVKHKHTHTHTHTHTHKQTACEGRIIRHTALPVIGPGIPRAEIQQEMFTTLPALERYLSESRQAEAQRGILIRLWVYVFFRSETEKDRELDNETKKGQFKGSRRDRETPCV